MAGAGLAALVAASIGTASPSAFADGAPLPAQDVQVTFDHWDAGQDAVHVTWTAPDGPVDGYRLVYTSASVDYAFVSDGPTVAEVAGDTTSADVDLPANEGPGRIWVFAEDDTPLQVSAGAFAATGWREAPALTAAPVSGIADEIRLTWAPAASADDHLVLRKDGGGAGPAAGSDVPLGDPTAGGSLTESTGTSQSSSTYALYEVSNTDPTQWSAASLASTQAAPLAEQPYVEQPGLMLENTTENPSTVTVLWGYPTGCTSQNVSVRRCSFSRAVIKPGTVAPTSPADGVQMQPNATDTTTVTGATFTGLTLGQTYSVSVFNLYVGGPLDGVYSPPISTTFTQAIGSELAWSATGSRTLTYGQTETVHGRLTSAYDGSGIAGVRVTLSRASHGVVTPLASALTDATGTVSIAYQPSADGLYLLTSANSTSYGTATTGTVTVDVRPTISLRSNHTRIHHGSSVHLTGTVGPKVAGGLSLQRYSGGAWHTIAKTSSSASGAYRVTLRISSRGTHAYRIARSATSTLSSATSATLHITGT